MYNTVCKILSKQQPHKLGLHGAPQALCNAVIFQADRYSSNFHDHIMSFAKKFQDFRQMILQGIEIWGKIPDFSGGVGTLQNITKLGINVW